jgi:hypothetical protein
VGTYLKNRNYGNISIFRQFGIVGTYTIGIVALVIRNYGILPNFVYILVVILVVKIPKVLKI